jgi:hypothetical protein
LTTRCIRSPTISSRRYIFAVNLLPAFLGNVITGAFSSPLGIALQLAMPGCVVALVRIDWAKRLARHG